MVILMWTKELVRKCAIKPLKLVEVGYFDNLIEHMDGLKKY